MIVAPVETRETWRVGDLCFALKRSPRRKTMQITVDRNGELVLSAPPGSRNMWSYTKSHTCMNPITHSHFGAEPNARCRISRKTWLAEHGMDVEGI